LVLDLRENVGGSMDMLRDLISHLFSVKVFVGTFSKREGLAGFSVEPAFERGFEWDLVVLIGSGTGSAAEVLASVVQGEGRGILVGDRTAGAVMLSESRRYEVKQGEGHWEFGLSVSVGDFRTPSGVRLEGRGVSPGETILPTRGELRRGEDPVLAAALGRLGLAVDAAQAGQIYSGGQRWRGRQ
jgi:carboxyl-terminal processing protease